MNIISYIKGKVDIVDYINSSGLTRLRKTGNSYRGACPICKGTNETEFSCNSHVYYCHRCHSGGNILRFYQDLHKTNFEMSVRHFSTLLNIDLSSDTAYQEELTVINQIRRVVEQGKLNLSKVEKYLTQERCLSSQTIAEFNLGATLQGSVIIPIYDLYGRPVSYSRRNFGHGLPKYLNEYNSVVYEKMGSLFNLKNALSRMTNTIYICEGQFDVMSGHDQGLPIVGYLGSEIGAEQVKLLRANCVRSNSTVILCPDMDTAGLNGILSMRKTFASTAPGFIVRVLEFPEDDFTFINPNTGEEVIRKCKDLNDLHQQGVAISSLPSCHIDLYALNKILKENPERDIQYGAVGEFIQTVNNPMVKADLAQYLSDYWGQDLFEIKSWFNVTSVGKEKEIEFKTTSLALEELEDDVHVGYFSTGIPSIDSSVGGLRKKDVFLIGAYPSTGKTLLAGQFALHCAVEQNLKVLFISLEMPASALVERIIASYMGISSAELVRRVKSGSIGDIYSKLKEKLDRNLLIVDESNIKFDDISKIIKTASVSKFDTPVDVVIVDYIQILNGIRTFEDIEYVAKRFKGLAKENNIIFLGLSQLARGSNSWERPIMSKLKGGGALEASGDLILMLYRKGENPFLPEVEKIRLANVVTCSIEKSRRGYNLKEVDLRIDKEKTLLIEE